MSTLAELAKGESVEQLVKDLSEINVTRVDIAKQIGAEIMSRAARTGVGYTFDVKEFLAAASGESSPSEDIFPDLRTQVAILDRGHEGDPIILSDNLGLRTLGRLALFSDERLDLPKYRFNFNKANDRQFEWSADVALSNIKSRIFNQRGGHSRGMFSYESKGGIVPVEFANGCIHYNREGIHVSSESNPVKIYVGAKEVARAFKSLADLRDELETAVEYFVES